MNYKDFENKPTREVAKLIEDIPSRPLTKAELKFYSEQIDKFKDTYEFIKNYKPKER